MINAYSTCNYVDVSSMMVSSFNKWGPQVPCKHVYYILQHVMCFGIKKLFTHYPSLNRNEIHRLLNHAKVLRVN
jgi:hypothetical protein